MEMNAIKIPDTSVRQIQRMSQVYIEGEPKNRRHSSEGDSTSLNLVSPKVRVFRTNRIYNVIRVHVNGLLNDIQFSKYNLFDVQNQFVILGRLFKMCHLPISRFSRYPI